MTEAEWLACDIPLLLLHELGERMSDRKYRLMVCCWLRGKGFADPRSAEAVVVAERFADGNATAEELGRVCEAARLAHQESRASGNRLDSFLAGAAASAARQFGPNQHSRQRWDGALAMVAKVNAPLPPDAEHCARIREVFGNPFRPVAFSPEWRTDTAIALASQMYESRDFSAMPILADALQDAGCDNTDILDHCRGEGPHVRGCWVVDLVLGKE